MTRIPRDSRPAHPLMVVASVLVIVVTLVAAGFGFGYTQGAAGADYDRQVASRMADEAAEAQQLHQDAVNHTVFLYAYIEELRAEIAQLENR